MALMGGYIPNLKKIPSAVPEMQAFKKFDFFFSYSSFHTLCKNRYINLPEIWKVNLINIQGVINDFTHKSSVTFTG